MRRLLKPLGLALGLFVSATFVDSCSADHPLGAPLRHAPEVAASSMPPVRISELHYDNTGTDAGERVEISGPAGTDLSGYSVVLYNGSGGAVYDTKNLTGTVPATCGERGVVVVSYAVNGIQNGAPDGLALVKSGALIEFLSYEGTFTGSGGAANGVPSTDIGVSQTGAEPIGSSLQRTGSGSWVAAVGATANSFGSCNDLLPPSTPVAAITVSPTSATIAAGSTQQLIATAFDESDNEIIGAPLNWVSNTTATLGVNGSGLVTAFDAPGGSVTVSAPSGVEVTIPITVTEPPPLPPTDIYISEFHYDNDGADVGEAIEVSAPAGTAFTGWSLVLYNGNGGASYRTISLNTATLSSCDGRALAVVPAVGIENGSPDGIALVNASGALVEFLSYEGTFRAANGAAKGYKGADVGVAESSSGAAGRSIQKDAIGWYGPNPSSFGACNEALDPFVSIATGRSNLPVGFEDQIFGTLNDGRGGETSSTFTWTSETPALASIDADGVVHANAAGTAILRATAPSGATGTASLPLIVATRGPAVYANHVEFGTPTDGDASDDLIIARDFYTTSFNVAKGIPNWVSFNLEATHIGGGARCDCFTYDAELPPARRYTTADYTGVGGTTPYHGYAIDRGHLLRSFDRESGLLDNANTFYFSNIIPQAADNNQGPWAALEIYLGDLARFSNKEIFVISGASGSKGTVKDEGKITIPEWTWKVAVILPRDQGLANVDSWDDVEVIAVIMPNVAGIRNVNWNTYRTTVNAVEALSGYDLLSLLPKKVEAVVETGMQDEMALLEQLASAGNINRGNANSLAVKLEAAASSIERGDAGAARNQLESLLRELGAMEDKRLSAADTAAFRAAVEALINSLPD